jgi:hypothetical protein
MIDVSPDYLENLYRYHLTGKWHTDFTDGDDDKIMLRYMTENPELFEKCFPEVKAESVRQEHVKRDEVIIGDNKLDASQLLELLQKRKLTIEGITINGRKCTAVLKMDENNKIEKQFHPLKRNQHLGATATKPTTTKAPMTKRKGVGMS